MYSMLLNGIWKVAQLPFTITPVEGLKALAAPDTRWRDATVPGEIHLDLMRAGEMPEPDFGLNGADCRWPEQYSWWYRTVFTLDESPQPWEELMLVLEGLDLSAWVFVNGKQATELTNALIAHDVDITTLVQQGENELIVRLTAGSELALDDTISGQGHPYSIPTHVYEGALPKAAKEGDLFGHRWWSGKKWLRKAQFTYGWDWCDALPNIGIWRDVRIELRSWMKIGDIRADYIIDNGSWLEIDLFVENLHYAQERAAIIAVELLDPDGNPCASAEYQRMVLSGGEFIRDRLRLKNPQLWYPNGMGAQPLYTLRVSVMDGERRQRDAKELTIGLRTIEIQRPRTETGSRMCIIINGEECFCRGANIGPLDTILARLTADDYEDIVRKTRDANMNMLRINGCSIYEHDAFYEYCDRYGIMVWQDFMLTDTTYPETPAYKHALVDEAVTVMRRLRHHASLVLWCANNECQQVFDIWNRDPDQPKDLGGKYYFNILLPQICRMLDPHKPFWPGSPIGGDFADDEISGDTHWWFLTYMSPDMESRIDHEVFDRCRSGFVSEYGAQAPCHQKTIDSYLLPEQQHADHPAWQVHTNVIEHGTIACGIRRLYDPAFDEQHSPLAQYIYQGQLLQSNLLANAMEALRFRKQDAVADCQGSLLWSLTDCRGETGWSVIDYQHRVKASYYGLKRACKPLKLLIRKRDGGFAVRLINDTLHSLKTTIECGFVRLDGSCDRAHCSSQVHTVEPNSMAAVFHAPLDNDRYPPTEWLFIALLYDADGQLLDQAVYVDAPYHQLTLRPFAPVNTQISADEIEIVSPTFAHAVYIEDGGTGSWSDNWFDLIPNIPNRIRCSDMPDSPAWTAYSRQA